MSEQCSEYEGEVQEESVLNPAINEDKDRECVDYYTQRTENESEEETTEDACEESAVAQNMPASAGDLQCDGLADGTSSAQALQTAGDLALDQHDQNVSEISSMPADMGSTTATVKITILPDGHTVTLAFAIGHTIQDLKDHFANELKIPPDVIRISLDGGEIDDHNTLMTLGVQPHGTIQLEMTSADLKNHPIRPIKLQPEYSMSDVITVKVQTDGDPEAFQDVVVEIERATYRKAFLGGYRNRITGVEFHHAAVQTLPRKRPDQGIETFCRDTQTVDMKTQSQQCTSSTSTQMTKIGCYVSNMQDKLVSPGVYVTADEHHTRRLQAVMVLQTHVRRWQAKQLTDQLRQDRARHEEWLRAKELRRKKEKEEQIRVEFQRRINPTTQEDFEVLYSDLEKWRKEEVQQIDATLSGPERKAALCALLDKETQLIASVDQHRIAALKKNRERSVQAFLDKCAAPKRWRAFDGRVTQMDTQFTIRAQELRDLYNSVTVKYLSQDERRDVLLTVKHTVKEHSSKLTQDIVELIDREMDLMVRGVKEANLAGLRQRISTLFLQFIKTPDYNPEASKYVKVPQDPVQFRKGSLLCRSCGSYLGPEGFSVESKGRAVGRCRRCSRLDNEACRREDLSFYRDLLKHLRQVEASGKIPLLLQEKDMRYLVHVVWRSQSALSAWDDMHDLVMARWDTSSDWSPWNCILLTKDEAAAHLKVEHPEQVYAEDFISRVKHMHTLARKYFSHIPAIAKFLGDINLLPASNVKPSACPSCV